MCCDIACLVEIGSAGPSWSYTVPSDTGSFFEEGDFFTVCSNLHPWVNDVVELDLGEGLCTQVEIDAPPQCDPDLMWRKALEEHKLPELIELPGALPETNA
mmetsp:Transcript_13906/g.30814  ORF Transcript_13906/g.30814 Transcript_13906/m.30814 type:complete len:101 (-) Transcript_13906:243-545(-)